MLGCDTTFSTVDECADIVSALLSDPSASAALSAHIIESSSAWSGEAYFNGIDESLRDLGVL